MGSNRVSFDPSNYLVTQIGVKQKRPPFNKRVAVLKISIVEIVNFLGNLKQD